jgi:hypothetical protein
MGDSKYWKLSEVKKTYLSISDLVNGGFIEQDEIKDPRTSKDMNGCVVVSYNSQKVNMYINIMKNHVIIFQL